MPRHDQISFSEKLVFFFRLLYSKKQPKKKKKYIYKCRFSPNFGFSLVLINKHTMTKTGKFTPWDETTGNKTTTANNTSYILSKKPLGDGSYSVVFECKNTSTGRHYAAKKYNKRLMYGFENMLKNEFKVLNRISLSHSHLLSLIDFFETEESFYLVTDLARGGDLWNKIAEEEKLNEQTTRTITRQLVESVEFLHKHQILHHDIKAENVFFQSKHQDTILLGDFGLAKILQPQEKLHEVAGTLSYIAPEMLDYKIGYDFPIDVWALGVCVYFMLCGYMPFDCDGDEETKDAIRNRKYLFEPSEYWVDVSSEAKDFILACLQVDPQKRLTASQLLQHSFLKINLTKPAITILLPLKRSFSNLSALQRDQIKNILQKVGGVSAPALSHSSSINEKLERGRFDSLNKDATLNGAICPSPECVSIFSSPANSTSVSRDGSGLNIFEELLKWDSSQKKALPLNTLRQGASFAL